MAFTKSEKRYTVKQFIKLDEKEQIRGDLAIQRNDVWDVRRQSLLIHSFIMGYPIPTIFAEDTGDKTLWLMDGKQRKSAIVKFVGNGFPLHKETPDYEREDGTKVVLNGKFFKDLDEDIQDLILDYNMLVWSFRGMTDEEKETMFIRLNGGMPLKSVELLRVHAGTKTMEIVTMLKNMHFFSKSVNISKAVKNRFGDEESIFQIMYLMDANSISVGFGGDELRAFVEDIRFRGLEKEFVDNLVEITKYLGEAIPAREGFLKKVNLPMLFYVANKAIEMKIPAPKFGGWTTDFFKENAKADTEYSEACASGTGKAEKVKTRIQIMLDHFTSNIDKAGSYYNEKYEKELKKQQEQQARSESGAGGQQVASSDEPDTADTRDGEDTKSPEGAEKGAETVQA